VKDAKDQVIGHRHELAMVSIVGGRLTLPVDVEPFGPGDSEFAAGRRLLARAVGALGPRFAQYFVGDAKFAAASFLNDVQTLGLDAIVRLKDNLPDLHRRATVRFQARAADAEFELNGDRIEVWDDDTFQPWEGLHWPSVRVLRYRQHKRSGETIDAYWLSSFSKQRVGSLTLMKLAKSRWEIENEGFNEAKTRHGMEHICRHEKNSVLVGWLLMLLAMVIERLYRLRYLHRGNHPVLAAAELLTRLWVALGTPRPHDSS